MTLPKILNQKQDCNTDRLYDLFLVELVKLHQSNTAFSLDGLIGRYLSMNDLSLLEEVNKLKAWLDSFRPLSPVIIEELKKLYDVQFTYNSNTIEGNTLTQSETELVLSKGITVGGKTLLPTEHIRDRNWRTQHLKIPCYRNNMPRQNICQLMSDEVYLLQFLLEYFQL